MAIDDEIDDSNSTRAISEEAKKSVQEMLVRSQLMGLICWFLPPWLIPVGAAIDSVMNRVTTRRLYVRLEQMRETMHSRLKEVDESKVDRDWFKSEEFQTMLFEATRQATVTADRKKIAMLGNALANGGLIDFTTEDRKDLFLQLVRDLTSQHIAMLRRLAPKGPWRPRMDGHGEDLLVLQMLAANGLVTESLESKKAHKVRLGPPSESALRNAERQIKQLTRDLQRPPDRVFSLSSLRQDFISFVGLPNIPE